MKHIFFAAVFGVALSLGVGSAVAAKSITIIDVGTGNSDLGNVSVAGFGTPWTTPILMTDSQGKTFTVFCDDLYHYVYVGSGQSLAYHFGAVTTNGNGQSIGEAVSNEIGQLAEIGDYDFSHHNEDGAIAAQAAIWNDEYNTKDLPDFVSSTDNTINNDITYDITHVTNNGKGWAYGLIADGGTQSEVLGLPEPSSWALLLLGVFGVGAMLRRRPLALVSAA
jgi:hypothetical protein